MKRNDIAQAARYFDSENRNNDKQSKIVIPEHMKDKARAIEKEFKRPVVTAPIRGDAIYISTEQGI